MQQIFNQIRSQICSTTPIKKITDEQWNSVKDKITVAFMAGGESSRFQSVPGALGSNKNSYKLPNGDTMIEMTLRMYRDTGIENFVCLLFHKGEEIEELLGDGSRLGVHITYSYDPDHPVGKGGAVLNALQNGAIPKDHTLVVHNPTDLIFDYAKCSNASESFVKDIISKHLEGIEQGSLATVVVVKEQAYGFTGMRVQNNLVEEIEMYPMIPIPTHIGVTVIDPSAFNYFESLFDLSQKSDFEQVLFPVLAGEKKLYVVDIPTDCWLPVKDLKGYKSLLKKLE